MSEILIGLKSVLQQHERGAMQNVVISPELVKQLGKEMEQMVLANLTTEKRLAGLAPQEVLSQYTPDVVLSHYAPEQRLSGLTLEQRLAGFEAEVLEEYLRKLQQPSPVATHRKKATRRKQKPKADVKL
jgi:hypothetical protein